MKNKMIKVTVVAVFAAIAGYGVYASQENVGVSDLLLDDVESMAACESVGWKDNDGNCVTDNNGTYFCKKDTWYEITDCLQVRSKSN